MTKNQRLTIRISQRQADELAARADAAGVTISDHARHALTTRLNLEQLATGLARDLAAELRADFQTRDVDLDAKLKLISDQLAALSMLVREIRK